MPGFDMVTMNYRIFISILDSIYMLTVLTRSGGQNLKLVNQDGYNG